MSSSPRATSAAILARKDSRVAQVSEFWDLDGIFDEAWSRKGLELRMGVGGKSCGCCLISSNTSLCRHRLEPCKPNNMLEARAREALWQLRVHAEPGLSGDQTST